MTEAVQSDPLLLPFVRAEGGAEFERQLAALIAEHAEPVVTRIVGYKVRAGRGGGGRAEAEDVRGEVLLQLVQRLHSFRADHAERGPSAASAPTSPPPLTTPATDTSAASTRSADGSRTGCATC